LDTIPAVINIEQTKKSTTSAQSIQLPSDVVLKEVFEVVPTDTVLDVVLKEVPLS